MRAVRRREWTALRAPRLPVAALALVLSFAPPAHAGDKAAADALFVTARQLMDQGDYANACPKLAESQRLDPATGTLMNLGLCYEKNGQTASAWTTYREAASLARDKGQAEREQTARDAVVRIEPQLLKVVISATPPPDGSQVDVKIDGQPFPSGLFGVQAPMDPGTHQLTATGQGKKPFVTSFTVQAGPPATVTIPVLELAPEEPAAGPPPTATPGAPAPEAEPKNDGHGQRIAAVILGGVGVAAVGVGSVFGLMANSSYSASKNECNGDHCTQAGHDDRERAFGQATVATVGFAVGGAALIGGAIVWFTAPKAHTEQPVPPAVSFAPFVGPGIAGVGVGGRL